MRLLVVEDHVSLADELLEGLKLQGYAVDWLQRGDEAEAALMAHRYDCVVLDPPRDGARRAAELGAQRPHHPHRGGLLLDRVATRRRLPIRQFLRHDSILVSKVRSLQQTQCGSAMRTARANGVSVTALAKRFAVHRGTIWAKTRHLVVPTQR